jgi:hypothetical protein
MESKVDVTVTPLEDSKLIFSSASKSIAMSAMAAGGGGGGEWRRGERRAALSIYRLV